MTDPDLTAPEAVEAHIDRIDPYGHAKPKSLNDDTKTLLRALSARAEAFDAKLKEAGEHIEAVSDAFAKQIGVRRHNAWPIIRAARAFLASLEGDKP